MAVMIPEAAAEAAGSSRAALAGASARRRAAHAKPSRAAQGGGRGGSSQIPLPSQIGRHAQNQGPGEHARRAGQQYGLAAGSYAAGKAGGAARRAGRASLPGDRRYQGVILAEFLVAVLIVALAPLVRGKASDDTSSGPSPYGVDDIKQLAGIGAAYFVLALLSSGKHGRYAAWFGGLILAGIGLSETTSGGLAGIFGLFKPGALSGGTASSDASLPGIAAPPDSAQASDPLYPDVGSSFPVITSTVPSPSGQPTFNEQVVQGNATDTVYSGGPGVVTTNTGTQLA